MGCNNRDRRDQVAGAFDRDRNRNRDIKFRGTINEEDFCRAVRRCLEELLAGAEDDRDDKCRRRDFWF